jgi:hypothetical protein
VKVNLRCPLHSGAAGVQAPDIELLGTGTIERFVLLDRGSSVERIDWETTGLLAAGATAAASLPAGWRDSVGDLYRVITPRFDATARLRQTSAPAPQVHLADIRADLLPGRRMAVTAGMTIHPAGARGTVFMLPPGCRLVQVLVDGVATPSTRSGLRSWQIAAPSELLPYRLTIVYDTFVPAHTSAEGIRLMAPQLQDVQVKQTLWTVRSRDDGRVVPLGANVVSSDSTAQPTSAQRAALARLEAAEKALDSVAAAQGTNLPAGAVAESYVRWRQVLNRDDRRLTDMFDQNDAGGEMALARKAVVDEADKVGQRLVQAGFTDQIQVAAAPSATAEDVQPASIQFITNGPASELHVTFATPPMPLFPSTVAVAWLTAFAAVVGWLVSFSALARDWLQAHVPFLVGLCGIAWWLVAPAGWLGWLLMLFALWFAVSSPWPRAAYEPSSTRQRLSGSHWQ